MLPDLSEWDLAVVQELADPNARETLNVEKKAADILSLTASGKVASSTREKIAKQICAFSNAEGGFIVIGIKDSGGLDSGVPATIGGEHIASWAEKPWPGINPPVVGCQARFIEYPSNPGHGGLVIQVPQSERRPHWFTDSTGKDWPYLRVGAQSLPMSLRTFLDIRSRGPAPRGEIVPPDGWSLRTDPNRRNLQMLPTVRLLGGPVCERWILELSFEPDRLGEFTIVTGVPGYQRMQKNRLVLRGTEPLYPGRVTLASGVRFSLQFSDQRYAVSDNPLVVQLWCESASPVIRRIAMSELTRIAIATPG